MMYIYILLPLQSTKILIVAIIVISILPAVVEVLREKMKKTK